MPRGPVARWLLGRRNRNRRGWRDPFLELDDAKLKPSRRLADFWSLRLALARLADQGLVVVRGKPWRQPFFQLDQLESRLPRILANLPTLVFWLPRLADQGLVVIRGKLRGNPLFQFDDPKLAFPLSRLGPWGVLRTLRVT